MDFWLQQPDTNIEVVKMLDFSGSSIKQLYRIPSIPECYHEFVKCQINELQLEVFIGLHRFHCIYIYFKRT